MENHNHEEHNHTGHSHSHDVSNLSGEKIFWVTVLNSIITIAEILGGIFSGSLALLSDSLHNLSDTISIVLSYVANKISHKEKNSKKTFGYKRAEILVAFINATALFIISFWLIIEAYKRLTHPETINSNLMLIVATIGLIANFISVYLLEKDSHENMNIKSSYLHLISDTVSSIGVILGGLAIKYFDIVWIDPLITFLISLYIIRETWHILSESIDILMQSSPKLDYEHIKKDIENIDKVKNIHHVHTWRLDEKTIHFEAHIKFEDMTLSEIEKIYEKIEHLLHEHYGISHITIQPEVNRCDEDNLFKV
ncbi:MAG: cobalt-zinc-cadmium efflux system protein [Fusobacteriaceae bacterium]|jgi:cobalt-zinc-cadmium efflux system protein|nr:cobalt-zinc-cadmium efflux system protein [Fusobacteriaceae bacterium]